MFIGQSPDFTNDAHLYSICGSPHSRCHFRPLILNEDQIHDPIHRKIRVPYSAAARCAGFEAVPANSYDGKLFDPEDTVMINSGVFPNGTTPYDGHRVLVQRV